MVTPPCYQIQMRSKISQREPLSVVRDIRGFAIQALSDLIYATLICKLWRTERFQSISQTQEQTKVG